MTVGPRHTRRDPTNQRTRAALAMFAAAQHARAQYDQLLQEAISQYGDRHHPTDPGRSCATCAARGYRPDDPVNHQTGSAIAGIYADHFPERIKAQLRTYARIIGEQTDQAFELWHAAGRRWDTIRPWQAAARQLPDGRTSYY